MVEKNLRSPTELVANTPCKVWSVVMAVVIEMISACSLNNKLFTECCEREYHLIPALISLVRTRHGAVVTAAPVVLVAMEKHSPPATDTICSVIGYLVLL